MVRGEMAGDGRSTADRETAVEANDGEGVLVGIERGEVVRELRGLTAVLARGSERAEDGCSGGSMARLGSPALRVERRRVLGRRSGEQAKGRTEWGAGVFVVLVRALGEGGGLCSKLTLSAEPQFLRPL